MPSPIYGGAILNLTNIPTRNFSNLQNIPTTASGYGITDALVRGNNLSDLTIPGTALTNLGGGIIGKELFHVDVVASFPSFLVITNSSTVEAQVASDARSSLGLAIGSNVVGFNGALGTPSSGTLTSCTFPTLNQNTTGSAASLSISGQTGLLAVTGLTSTNRIKTVRDAADTILELGGSYTPTGTWTNLTLVAPSLGAVTQTGKTTTYNNIATVSNGVPSEVATIDSTGLTANVGASTLYAVPASGAGLYRVSAYLVTTTAASISSTMPNAQVVYTDSDSNTSVTLDVSPILGAAGLGQSGLLTANAVGTVFSGTVVVYAKASTTIQYQTVNYASTAGGMAYALRMKLEAL